MINPDINDFITPAESIPSIEEPSTSKPLPKTYYDPTLSDMEQSINLLAMMMFAPTFNFPIIPAAQDGKENTLIAILADSKNANENRVILMSENLISNDAKKAVTEGWSNNLREISEQVAEILNSPQYQMGQELRLKVDTQLAGVKPVDATAISSLPTPITRPSILSYIDSFQSFEQVPKTAIVPNETTPKDPTRLLTIPLLGGFIVGGAVAVGSLEISSTAAKVTSNPLQGAVEFVNRLQPLYPEFIQNVLPTINLLVMPLIYYTSWDASIGNITNKQQQSYQKIAENFAKAVIKMVADPAFIYTTLVNNVAKAQTLTPDQQNQLSAVLKLILSTVALSLLYALEVGKAMGNKFWGMEPQEFKGMLMGDIPIPDPEKDKKKRTEADKLKWTLLKQIKEQLQMLPPQEKEALLEAIFEYLTTAHAITDMVDPAKVFEDVLSGGTFNHAVVHLETAAA